MIDVSPEHSSEKIVAAKLPEVEALQTTENKPSREKAEQPARVSNLELENKLLRKEVDSLNAELLSFAQRSKESQERKLLWYTVENAHIATSLLTFCNRFVAPSNIRMGLHGLRRFVDKKSVASCQLTCRKLIVKTCYPQACYKLFQQVVTSLQMTSCNKPDFNTPVTT